MIKAVLALLVAALTAAVLLTPNPDPPAFDLEAANDAPPVAVCPVEEGSGRITTVGIASEEGGEGRLTGFAGGSAIGAVAFNTGVSGSAAVPVADVAAVGTAAGLVELPGATSAAAALLTGAESVALDTCQSVPAQQTLLAGGSTIAGQQFQLHLMNPYAGEALVDLVVQSESGLETAPQLRGISVPARSSIVLDLSELLPGRASLSIAVEVVNGGVMAAGRFGVGSDVALWHAVEPALDWFVPVPASGLGGDLVISSGIGAEIEYQLDEYGPEGLIEASQEGVIPERGTSVVPLSEFGFEVASAFRVISTQPVAVFLRSVSDTTVAMSSGSTATAASWLLPGAGLAPGSSGSTTVLNAGLEDATVVVSAHREQSVTQEVSVPAGTVVEIPALGGGANAYTIRGEGSLVPLWTTTAAGVAYSSGVSIGDE